MKNVKISLSIILFLVLMFMAGCGKGQQINTPDNDKRQDDIVGTIQWNVSHAPMLEQYEP